ncbi:hypothetical protein LCGC14_0607980 [marine sediment metagenome]|uniref:Uncharacterized protein n=1 Tax=marine sediment metagenome TaxID=412755 RepID=A0A0F9RSR4_9ZZZZ
MKTRLGFVSNSSSSSFICLISDEVVSGMDLELEEAGMYECINGHVFSEQYLLEDVPLSRVRDDTAAWCRRYPERFNVDDPDFETKLRNDDHRDHRQYYIKRYAGALVDAAEQVDWIEQYNPTDGDEALQFAHDFTEKFGKYSSFRYEVPSAFCPICRLVHIQDKDLMRSLLATVGRTRADLVVELQGKFGSLNELRTSVLTTAKTNTEVINITLGETP